MNNASGIPGRIGATNRGWSDAELPKNDSRLNVSTTAKFSRSDVEAIARSERPDICTVETTLARELLKAWDRIPANTEPPRDPPKKQHRTETLDVQEPYLKRFISAFAQWTAKDDSPELPEGWGVAHTLLACRFAAYSVATLFGREIEGKSEGGAK